MADDASRAAGTGGQTAAGLGPRDFALEHYDVDLTTGRVVRERLTCEDLEDVLGGIARGLKLLESARVEDAYLPQAPLLLNLGRLTGSPVMTGLRTFFHAFSPLKRSGTGQPSAMWSAGSGKFGTQIRLLGIDEILFVGCCQRPSLLHIALPDGASVPKFRFEDAEELVGRRTNDKIQVLARRFPGAHFAVIGPAGEHYRAVRYGAIALSTENQLKSGDAKARFCGRGGMGSIMGSKNLLAIIADAPYSKAPRPVPLVKALNKQVATGDGSRRFREPKTGGLGGTWANYTALNPEHALPERNFSHTGSDVSEALYRENVEGLGRYVIRGEACYGCAIRCHKNVYDRDEKGGTGRFRAKLDFEPLDLLSSNIGIYDVDKACDLTELVDGLGLDAISAGVCLSYAMEYNRRHPGAPIAGGLSYGDFDAARRALESIGKGEMDQLGQGVLRLSEQLAEGEFAMHSKGIEFPAYLPQTNPGYPWALAGGHMSMRTYLLLLNERETGLDYWVDAISNPRRGISILRDDILGTCKFAGLPDEEMVQLVRAISGLELDVAELRALILRTFLRGYRLERLQGFGEEDYALPPEALQENPAIGLPYFNTPEFFSELRRRVLARFDALLGETEIGPA